MASNIKVYVVNHAYKADYKVFFVSQSHKEQNASMLKGGQLVNHEYQATIKVFIVYQEYKANVKIMQQNFPK